MNAELRVVDGLKVAFVESASYFESFLTPSMHSTAKATGADVVFLLADGKSATDVSDEEIRTVLNGIADAKEETFPAALRAQPAGGGEVVALMDKFRALVAAHDGEFAFVDGVKLCLRELEAAIAGCQTEGRELPKYFVEYSECEKAAYMRGIAVGENIASRDPVFAALDSVVPGWREHGSDTASAAATAITELSARATSNGSKPFRWDDDEGEAPSAWGPK